MIWQEPAASVNSVVVHVAAGAGGASFCKWQLQMAAGGAALDQQHSSPLVVPVPDSVAPAAGVTLSDVASAAGAEVQLLEVAIAPDVTASSLMVVRLPVGLRWHSLVSFTYV